MPTVIVVISPASADVDRLVDILRQMDSAPIRANTCAEGLSYLSKHRARVVLSCCTLPDGTWRNVADGIQRLRHPPNLVVFSRLADEWLWAKTLETGAFDLLMCPFREREVVRTVAAASLERPNRPLHSAGHPEHGMHA